jgi:phosphatidylglycerophosphate synthase
MTSPRSDSKIAVKRTAATVLNTAVIVASGPIFGEASVQASGNVRPVGALTRVAGLSLFQRTVLTLQRAGMTQLFVLADQDEDALRRGLSEDRRVTALVRWIPVREFPPGDIRTWEALAADIRGVCLVVGVHAVFSPGLVEDLRREVQDGRSLLAVTYLSEPRTRSQVFADMLVLPVSLLGGSGNPPVTMPDEHPLRMIMTQASASGRLRTIVTAMDSSGWYRPVREVADVREAERLLFQSLKNDQEGFVDTYFNRKVSGALTRLFVGLRWSPNVITVLSILIGLAAAASFSLGTYVAGVMGALLFQLSAIVDCCDGELARLTFRESRFGEQFDLIGDNVVHMAIFAGMAWAVYKQTQSWVPLALGGAAMVGNGLSLSFVTRIKARLAQKSWSDPEQATRSNFILRNVASRDFSVIVLLFALMNGLGWFLWLAAIGSNLFWMFTVWATGSRAER